MSDSTPIVRITRPSNNRVTWVILFSALFSLVVCLAIGVLSFLERSITFWMFAAMSAFMLYTVFQQAWRLMDPHELEFVLDREELRYGRADRPESQTRIGRTQIRELMIDSDNGNLYLDTGRTFTGQLAYDIVLTKADRRRVVVEIRENWPEVKIVVG